MTSSPEAPPTSIPSQVCVAPRYPQWFSRSSSGLCQAASPVTERVAASTLAVPFSSQFTDDEVSHVADALIEVAYAEAQS